MAAVKGPLGLWPFPLVNLIRELAASSPGEQDPGLDHLMIRFANIDWGTQTVTRTLPG